MKGKKRKREGDVDTPTNETAPQEGVSADGGGHDGGKDEGKEAPAKKMIKTAATGFVHILPPTPELWTASLPHRTQVVYTPDYSYILHRLKVRPGSTIIEAGAGSGSFTHAAARAVFNGYPNMMCKDEAIQTEETARDEKSSQRTAKDKCGKKGKVYSFEFHEQRYTALKGEIADHGLNGVVEITHRDVCEEGFVPENEETIHADAIFLDLPAPWLALKHLTRQIRRKPPTQPSPEDHPPISTTTAPNPTLNPHSSIHICTFSPCIEQVTRTISTLRAHGYVDIAMVELSAKKIEVRRERVGLQEEGLRGVNPSPKNVREAVERLREVEARSKWFHEIETKGVKGAGGEEGVGVGEGGDGVMEVGKEEGGEKEEGTGETKDKYISKQARLSAIAAAVPNRKLYKEGRLVTKAEPELKTHTSYLVFAILPREWSEEDEAEAQRIWGRNNVSNNNGDNGGAGAGKDMKRGQGDKPMSKRQRKKEAKTREGGNKCEVEARAADVTERDGGDQGGCGDGEE